MADVLLGFNSPIDLYGLQIFDYAFGFCRRPEHEQMKEAQGIEEWLETVTLDAEVKAALEHFMELMEDHPAPTEVKQAAFFCFLKTRGLIHEVSTYGTGSGAE